MATYVVGDIHGCLDAFHRLLVALGFDPTSDRLYHTGDLINGGEDSLGVLRWFYHHQNCADSVLGNHDLHLLAVAHDTRRQRQKDDFDDILQAPDRDDLIAWLLHRPLLVDLEDRRILVHAGLHPRWTVDDARAAAAELQARLRGKRPEKLLAKMYGNEPRRPKKNLPKKKRHRLYINIFTRMRVMTRRGKLDFKYTGTYKKIPSNRRAWFDMPDPAWEGHQIHCGHWSALGLRHSDRVVALDTGCRWGRRLTAIRLDDGEVFSVAAEG